MSPFSPKRSIQTYSSRLKAYSQLSQSRVVSVYQSTATASTLMGAGAMSPSYGMPAPAPHPSPIPAADRVEDLPATQAYQDQDPLTHDSSDLPLPPTQPYENYDDDAQELKCNSNTKSELQYPESKTSCNTNTNKRKADELEVVSSPLPSSPPSVSVTLGSEDTPSPTNMP